MANFKVADHATLVPVCLQKLEPSFAKMMEAVRQTILRADEEIGEPIKWNAPVFITQAT
jgi:hypothetical protein